MIYADVAQLAEQLTCNQQVIGSSPIIGFYYMDGFPSGQRGQTVNLLATLSVVRIHLHPFQKHLIPSVVSDVFFIKKILNRDGNNVHLENIVIK